VKSVQSVVSSSEYKFKAHTEHEDDRLLGTTPCTEYCAGVRALDAWGKRIGGLKLDKEHEDKLELDLGTKQ